MLQARVGSRKVAQVNFEMQRSYFGSSCTKEYLNSFRNVFQRFTPKFLTKTEHADGQTPIVKKTLKKHSHQLRTILEKNRKAKLLVTKEIPTETMNNSPPSDIKTVPYNGFLQGLYSKLNIWKSDLPAKPPFTTPA
ncbi:hypothetical protein K7432_014443, partial [Basidiobolus ranarum]